MSDLVVEVELETENPPTIALPQELVDLLSAKLSPDVLQQPDEYSKVSRHCPSGSRKLTYALIGLNLPPSMASCLPLLRDGVATAKVGLHRSAQARRPDRQLLPPLALRHPQSQRSNTSD